MENDIESIGELEVKELPEENDSVQPRTRGETASDGGPRGMFVWAGENIPPWWSPARDEELQRAWKKSDHMAGAIYNFASKIASIPFKVVPRDGTVSSHMKMAEEWQERLYEDIENGAGWQKFINKWVQHYVTTDNGAFVEIAGPGPANSNIVGEVTGVYNLDSLRCTRTNDPEYPIVYTSPNGSQHKLHYSRVAEASQMPSADEEMYGVGFCAVSRAIGTIQNLVDMSIYLQEKMGSLPNRGMVVVSGGLDPGAVAKSIEAAHRQAVTIGYKRYMPMIILGDRLAKDGNVNLVDTASVPDWFDLEKSTYVGMAIIALALGIDARELFPATVAGATKADAVLSHIKQRTRGIGEVLASLTQMFNSKVLPNVLKIDFDYQDDAQDMQVAEINQARAATRNENINLGVTTIRVEREHMVANGEITAEQFEELELDDGRLEDGTSVLTLFWLDDDLTQELLDLGVENPLMISENDSVQMLADIDKKEAEIMTIFGGNMRRNLAAKRALAALKELRKKYKESNGPPAGNFDVAVPNRGPVALSAGNREKPEVNLALPAMIENEGNIQAGLGDEAQLDKGISQEIIHVTSIPVTLNPTFRVNVPQREEPVIVFSPDIRVPKVENVIHIPEQKEKSIPIINVNVPQQEPPVVNVSAKVELPTEENIEVERDVRGEITKLKKERKY